MQGEDNFYYLDTGGKLAIRMKGSFEDSFVRSLGLWRQWKAPYFVCRWLGKGCGSYQFDTTQEIAMES